MADNAVEREIGEKSSHSKVAKSTEIEEGELVDEVVEPGSEKRAKTDDDAADEKQEF